MNSTETLPEMKGLEEIKVEVTPKGLMFQRVVSKTYLNEWYISNVFRLAFRDLKDLKTTEEITEITESICMDIYEREMTWDAYDFIQGVLNNLVQQGSGKV